MKKLIFALLVVLFSAVTAEMAQTAETLRTIEDGVLRLHILANSDSEQDQYNKLLVRDALLARSEEWTTAASTKESAASELEARLTVIEAIAEETLHAQGCHDSVQAEICEMAFPIRTYGDVTLPAGQYQALRLLIGEGEGQNWWCVMYPSLCVPAVSDTEKPSVVMSEHFDESVCDMTMHPNRYRVRLKCVEWFRAVYAYAADFVKTTEAEDSEEDSRIEEAPQSKCIAELCAME
ncbi:MAG: stage II sporulation protein R [Oscillospiraceae bacterium]|nr:stage II sporulation protein R [Oscillospiraceae bacterium]